jgi:hypothetical protein
MRVTVIGGPDRVVTSTPKLKLWREAYPGWASLPGYETSTAREGCGGAGGGGACGRVA